MQKHLRAGVLLTCLLLVLVDGPPCWAQVVKPAFMLNGHDWKVEAGAFSPDGKLLATYGDDATVRLWDTTTGRQTGVMVVPGPDHMGDSPKHVVFSADGQLLAAIGPTNSIMVWDVASMHVKQKITVRAAWDYCAMALSPDSTRIAFSGGVNQTPMVYIYDLTAGKPLATAAMHSQPLSLAFSHDGKMLACGQSGNNLQRTNLAVIDPATGKDLFDLQEVLACPPTALGFSPDDKTLAADEVVGYSPLKTTLGDGYHAVKVWDVASKQLLYKKDESPGGSPAACVAYSADGKTLLHTDHGLDFSDAVTGAATRRLEFDQPLAAIPLAISADGSMFAAGTGRLVKLWKIEPSKMPGPVSGVLQLAGGAASKPLTSYHDGKTFVIQGHENVIQGVTFSSDSSRIFTVADDATIRSWDVATGAPGFVAPIEPAENIDGLYRIDGGKSLLYGNHLFATTTGHAMGDFVAIKFPWPGPMTISPDGKTMFVFAATDKIGAIEMLDTGSGAVIGAIPVLDTAEKIAVSPDGRYLALQREGTLKILDVQSGKELGKEGVIMEATPMFAPDGKTMLLMSDQPMILDVPMLKGFQRLTPADKDSRAAFSPDGKWLAVTEQDRIRLTPMADILGRN